MSQINNDPNLPVLRSDQPDIGLALLITIGMLTLLKLATMAYVLFDIEYKKYQYRKYMRLKEKTLTLDRCKQMYTNIRNNYNGQQLEFPFVKAIDDAYVAARYNLNADNGE